MKLISFFLLPFFIPMNSFASEKSCRYSVDPSQVQVNWIAYKTTDKVAVQGTLKEVSIKNPPQPQSTLKALLNGLKANGLVAQESQSDTGNPARDLTLFQKYFSLITQKAKFSGNFKQIQGDDQKGEMALLLEFNGKKKSVPMKYQLSEEGGLEILGGFNMLDFGLSKALDSIHQACETLHTGKDGVSKTWPDVGLKILAKIQKNCT